MSINRRKFIGAGLALGAATLLAPAIRAQEGAMRAIFWGGQARADRTMKVFDLFQAARGTPPILGEFMGFNDYWTKVATVTAGGNAPDLIQMDYRYIVEYARRGVLAALDDYLGDPLDLSDFDADQVEAGKVDGKLYGVSMGAGGFCLQVNASAYERAGLPLPSSSTTYADFVSMAADFSAANSGMRLLPEPPVMNPLSKTGCASAARRSTRQMVTSLSRLQMPSSGSRSGVNCATSRSVSPRKIRLFRREPSIRACSSLVRPPAALLASTNSWPIRAWCRIVSR